MIDLHCHLLAGIDDGPETIECSLAVARAAEEAGTKLIVATPHVSSRYPNDSSEIRCLVTKLNALLIAEGIDVKVVSGGEIAVAHVPKLDDDELGRLALGGGPWLLIEPPFNPAMTSFDAILRDLMQRGHSIVLAHPERCPALYRDPKMIGALVQHGVLCSITASSLTGRFGAQVQRFAMQLLEAEMVHNVASDAHDVDGRPPELAPEIERAGLGGLSEWLGQLVPAAVLAGEPIPPRPAFALTSRRRGLIPWKRRAQ